MGDGVALWRASRWPASRWRCAARTVIGDVVAASMTPTGLPADIIERIDAAYPFGERKYQPYKDWLLERKIFRGALAETPAVTADEIAACEVARDLIEDGDPDPVKLAALLAEAPNRLARKCPACGAKPGRECIEPVPADYDANVAPPLSSDNAARAWMSQAHTHRLIPVPHHARLVGHIDAGPLFRSQASL